MKIAGKEIKNTVAAGIIIFIAAVVIVTVSWILNFSSFSAVKGGKGKGNTVVSVRTMVTEETTLHGYVSTNGEVESGQY